MTKQRHTEWHRLIGAEVEIRRGGSTVRIGIVGDVTSDASAVWIQASACEPRRIYDSADGYEIWVEPRQLPGPNAYRMTRLRLYEDLI